MQRAEVENRKTTLQTILLDTGREAVLKKEILRDQVSNGNKGPLGTNSDPIIKTVAICFLSSCGFVHRALVIISQHSPVSKREVRDAV